MESKSTNPGVADLTSEHPGIVVEDYEQPRYSRRDTILTMAGVLMVMLLASLDQTIPLMAMLFFLLCYQRWRENRFDVGGGQRWLGMGAKST